jgi:hypothetical protein
MSNSKTPKKQVRAKTAVVNVFLTPELKQELIKKSDTLGISMNTFVILAIKSFDTNKFVTE